MGKYASCILRAPKDMGRIPVGCHDGRDAKDRPGSVNWERHQYVGLCKTLRY